MTRDAKVWTPPHFEDPEMAEWRDAQLAFLENWDEREALLKKRRRRMKLKMWLWGFVAWACAVGFISWPLIAPLVSK